MDDDIIVACSGMGVDSATTLIRYFDILRPEFLNYLGKVTFSDLSLKDDWFNILVLDSLKEMYWFRACGDDYLSEEGHEVDYLNNGMHLNAFIRLGKVENLKIEDDNQVYIQLT